MKSVPVFFDNQSGDRLQGIENIPSGKPPFPTVIIYHGLSGEKSEVNRQFTELAWLLCTKGFLVVRFDFRGHGESSRFLDEISLRMLVEDARDIFNWTRKRSEVDAKRIGVVNKSLSPAIYLRLNKGQIKATVYHSPALNLRDTIERGWGFGFKLGENIRFGSQTLTHKFYAGLKQYDPMRIIPYMEVPQLFISGTADTLIDPTLVIKAYRRARSIKKLKLIEGADHDFASKEFENEVNTLTLDWLEKYVK